MIKNLTEYRKTVRMWDRAAQLHWEMINTDLEKTFLYRLRSDKADQLDERLRKFERTCKGRLRYDYL